MFLDSLDELDIAAQRVSVRLSADDLQIPSLQTQPSRDDLGKTGGENGAAELRSFLLKKEALLHRWVERIFYIHNGQLYYLSRSKRPKQQRIDLSAPSKARLYSTLRRKRSSASTDTAATKKGSSSKKGSKKKETDAKEACMFCIELSQPKPRRLMLRASSVVLKQQWVQALRLLIGPADPVSVSVSSPVSPVASSADAGSVSSFSLPPSAPPSTPPPSPTPPAPPSSPARRY
jgi:hypothetical protein